MPPTKGQFCTLLAAELAAINTTRLYGASVVLRQLLELNQNFTNALCKELSQGRHDNFGVYGEACDLPNEHVLGLEAATVYQQLLSYSQARRSSVTSRSPKKEMKENSAGVVKDLDGSAHHAGRTTEPKVSRPAATITRPNDQEISKNLQIGESRLTTVLRPAPAQKKKAADV